MGEGNTGEGNSGNWNTGDYNIGNFNAGHWNAGSLNSGGYNTGNQNKGDSNTGYWNTGHRNSGHWNSGDWNSGHFNIDTPPEIRVFGQMVPHEQWCDFRIPGWLRANPWVYSRYMTAEEKAAHPEHVITGGFLRDLKSAYRIAFDAASPKDKAAMLDCPGFRGDWFEEITGISEQEMRAARDGKPAPEPTPDTVTLTIEVPARLADAIREIAERAMAKG